MTLPFIVLAFFLILAAVLLVTRRPK